MIIIMTIPKKTFLFNELFCLCIHIWPLGTQWILSERVSIDSHSQLLGHIRKLKFHPIFCPSNRWSPICE